MIGAEVSVIHRGGTTKSVRVLGWGHAERPIVRLHFTLAGTYNANLNHGWLEAPCDDWRIEPADLEKLRVWANETEHWVHVVPRSSGRPRSAKRAAPVHPKQGSFTGGGWQ